MAASEPHIPTAFMPVRRASGCIHDVSKADVWRSTGAEQYFAQTADASRCVPATAYNLVDWCEKIASPFKISVFSSFSLRFQSISTEEWRTLLPFYLLSTPSSA